MKQTITTMSVLLGLMAAATIVQVPTIPVKEYTGAAQTADVPESVLYDVTYNEPRTDAGEYEVELQLTDPVNDSWSGMSDDWVVVPFWIVRATNAWITTPSITSWTYGETAHVPVAGAKFGNVKVTYDGTAADGTEISGATSVTKAGNYEAVFTVAGNANYTGLTNRVPFTVAKAGVPGAGGVGGDISVNVSGYDGVYDGQGHSITVALSGSDASTFSVAYALNGNGPFSAAKPMFTNVCSETVWYVLSSPDYATVTNSATVKITKRAVTLTSGSASKTFDLESSVPENHEVTVGGDGFAEGEGASYEFPNSFVWFLDFPYVANIGEYENTFSYQLNAGTLASNYDIECVYGTLSITMIDEASVKQALGAGNVPTTVEIAWYSTNSCVSSASHDGVAAWEARVPRGQGYEVLSATIMGPKRVTFYWNCHYDNWEGQCDGAFLVDGATKAGISTYFGEEPGFEFVDIVIGAGQHTLKWTCSCYGVPIGNDCAELFIDELAIEAPTFDVDDGTGGVGGEASRFSYQGAYDGVGHGINVEIANAPTGMAIKYARGNASAAPTEGWSSVNPLCTNACDNVVVWYAVECAGYVSYTNNSTVTISKRAVALTSGSASKTYDGTALTKHEVAVGGDGFAAGEGASYSYAGSQTDVGESENVFTYTLNAGTKASNYEIATTHGTLTVTPKTLTEDVVWLVLPAEGYVYDGGAKTPAAAFGDGAPSIITADDFSVAFANNVNAGTATATFTGKRNYAGTVEKQYAIRKAMYDMNGARWNYAGEFPYDGTMKTVGVSGLPNGVAVASYTGNTATLPGTYTAHATFSFDSTNYAEPTLADLTWTIKSAEEAALREIFDGLPADIGPDGDGGWVVTLTDDIAGPLDIPDNLGHLTIDLNGHNLLGADGAGGDDTTPGGDGQGALRIVAGEGDGSATRLLIVTTGGAALVKGGDGGDGNPGGNGAAAIEVTGECRSGVLIDVGAGVTVRGGKGGDSMSGDGGNGGEGIIGDVGINEGTIIGGDGGYSEHGQGGDGGQGVTGDVGINDGTISGGQGGGTGDGTPGSDGAPVGGVINGGTGTVVRARVMPPAIAAKEYTGAAQVADIPSSARWSVAFNAGGTAVGSYAVALELTDPVRYRWPDMDGATIYLSFEITKATIDVTAVGWDYSEPLSFTAYPQEVLLTNLPAGVTATYVGNRATEAGTYTAHATLNYNTDNYEAAAIPDCTWTIKPAVLFGGGNIDSLGGDTINYSGTYDGEGHGISVILRDPRPAGACVRYSRTRNGPYADENPVFTNACRETIWYLVTADNYEVLANSATVTIDPKPLTAGLVKYRGLREETQDGEVAVVPTLVIEDEWPCQITENDWEVVAWTPRSTGGGTAVVRGRNNYTGQVTVEIGNEMTVLFDAVYGPEGGSLRTMTTQEPGTPYVFPTAPIYLGHEFLGWFTARDGGEEFAAGTIVSLADPDTLYAHWKVKTFRVSFELNGGTGDVEDFDAEYGSAFGALPTPRKSGYLFDGWWTSSGFTQGTQVAEGVGVPFEDTTLYAKWQRRKLWYTDSVFQLKSAAVYDGYVMDGDDVVAGTIQVKVGKPSRTTGMSGVTATVQLAGARKVNIKGTTFDGTLRATVKDGRELNLRLGADSLAGTFGGFTIDGSRNMFTAKDEDSKLVAAHALKRRQGTYMVAWREEGGWNGLSIAVGTKGTTKVSGTLADGTRVSARSQLLVGERECAVAVSWTKKASSVACLVWLCEDGTVECANLPGGASALIANAQAGAYLVGGAVFHLDADVVGTMVPGLQADLLPDGVAVRMNGQKIVVDKAGTVKLLRDKTGLDLSKAGTNPSGLKLSYAMKTGVFKGNFTLYTFADRKLKNLRASVTGVVLGGRGYGTASIRKVGSWPVTIE